MKYLRCALHCLSGPITAVAIALVLWAAALAGGEVRAGALDSTVGPTIVVRVVEIRNADGNITVALYDDDPETFLDSGARIDKLIVPAQRGMVEVRLAVPVPGVYAVTVYHDENANDDFDTSFLGLPLEGFGISNNPRVVFAPPTLAEAAFVVGDGETVVEINLGY